MCLGATSWPASPSRVATSTSGATTKTRLQIGPSIGTAITPGRGCRSLMASVASVSQTKVGTAGPARASGNVRMERVAATNPRRNPSPRSSRPPETVALPATVRRPFYGRFPPHPPSGGRSHCMPPPQAHGEVGVRGDDPAQRSRRGTAKYSRAVRLSRAARPWPRPRRASSRAAGDCGISAATPAGPTSVIHVAGHSGHREHANPSPPRRPPGGPRPGGKPNGRLGRLDGPVRRRSTRAPPRRPYC